jgi:hypothetical protein
MSWEPVQIPWRVGACRIRGAQRAKEKHRQWFAPLAFFLVLSCFPRPPVAAARGLLQVPALFHGARLVVHSGTMQVMVQRPPRRGTVHRAHPCDDLRFVRAIDEQFLTNVMDVE